MQVRRFSADLKTKVPGGHPGLYAVPIHVDQALIADPQAYAARVNGLPILTDRPLGVFAHYLDPHGQIDEHANDVPVLVLVIAGHGFTRVGGPAGETRAVGPGDAILWPAGLDHTIWAEDEPLETIVIDGPGERG